MPGVGKDCDGVSVLHGRSLLALLFPVPDFIVMREVCVCTTSVMLFMYKLSHSLHK